MTVSELIARLNDLDPTAEILTTWEGELVDVHPDEVRLTDVHRGYYGTTHGEHEAETELDDGRCFRCDDDRPAREGCFKAVVIG